MPGPLEYKQLKSQRSNLLEVRLLRGVGPREESTGEP